MLKRRLKSPEGSRFETFKGIECWLSANSSCSTAACDCSSSANPWPSARVRRRPADLAERHDRVVTKTEVPDQVRLASWSRETTCSAKISTFRDVLGRQSIATIPGRGYRFVAPLNNETNRHRRVGRAGDLWPGGSRGRTTVADNLPLGRAPLLSRSAEVVLPESLLASHQRVTLVGSGGISRSGLARRGVARDATLAEVPLRALRQTARSARAALSHS
jgi:hypothetical protein